MHRWHWKGNNPPTSLLQTLHFTDLLDKWPSNSIPMGALVGTLTAEAAEYLHLRPGIPVYQGGPDAYVGMLGLGAIESKKLALITGT